MSNLFGNPVVLLVGAGAVRNAWRPVYNVFANILGGTSTSENINCYLALSVYNTRHLYRKSRRRGSTLQDKAELRSAKVHIEEIRLNIADAVHAAELNGHLKVRKRPAKHRVESRMALVDLTATQTDNLLDRTQLDDLIKEDLLFRDRQLKRLRDEVLDLEDLDDSVSLTDFSLDEFRLDLLQFLAANRKTLEEAGEGHYAVVPAQANFDDARPGVLYCLRHRGTTQHPARSPGQAGPAPLSSVAQLNPLAPYYLILVQDDGTVRLGFAQPKKSMLLLRNLAAGQPSAYRDLCDLFDQRTHDGADMTHYSGLLTAALNSIAVEFTDKAAKNLTTARCAVLPTTAETPTAHQSEFDLVTWLVILPPAAAPTP